MYFLTISDLGIDSEGHAANFVETEQIVHYNGSRASFVQASEPVGTGPPASSALRTIFVYNVQKLDCKKRVFL